MRYEKIDLYEHRRDVHLTAYLQEDSPEITNGRPRPAVLVCPGGAYVGCSDREAEPIALAFAAMGYHAFVLKYSTYLTGAYRMDLEPRKLEPQPTRNHPQPVRDLGMAMKYLYEHADAWHLNSSQIAICGFSAGGHNCAMYGVYWNRPLVTEYVGGAYPAAAMILGYPLTDYRFANSQSTTPGTKFILELCNASFFGTLTPTQAQLEEGSPVLHVGPHTPPTYLWATAGDSLVHPHNALAFAQQLAAHRVPFELHIFEKGEHGLALATPATAGAADQLDADAAKWVPLAEAWLRKHLTPQL